ncbi:MAG: CAP domain-containing protein [Pseudomonadota bacterium]
MPIMAILAILGGVGALFGVAGGGGSSSGSAGTTSPATVGRDTTAAPDGPDAEETPDDPPEDPDTPDIVIPAPAPPPSDPDPAPTAPDLPGSAYELGWDGLSAEEQMIVELINRARLDPDGEVARQGVGFASGVNGTPKEALAVTEALSEASRAHSQDMDARDFFAHTNLSGQSPADRAVEEGHGSRFVGENIGWIGSSRTGFDAQDRAEAHHDNLWASPGHQQNLMSNNWSEVGLGYDYGAYRGLEGSTFATEMFGDRGTSYLTGVVIDDTDGDEFYDIGEGQADVRITAYRGDDAFATSTWDSGGYSLALEEGTYRVVFEGGDLASPHEEMVTIGPRNVKLDVIEGDGGGSFTLAAAPGTEATGTESATLAAAPQADDGSVLLSDLLADTSEPGWEDAAYDEEDVLDTLDAF